MRSRLGIAGAIAAGLLGLWLWLAPPRPLLNVLHRVEPTPEVGARLVRRYGCRRCHRIKGRGALKAPSLDDVMARVDDPAHVALRMWLRNPRAVKPSTTMPNFHLSDSEIDAILAYLERGA